MERESAIKGNHNVEIYKTSSSPVCRGIQCLRADVTYRVCLSTKPVRRGKNCKKWPKAEDTTGVGMDIVPEDAGDATGITTMAIGMQFPSGWVLLRLLMHTTVMMITAMTAIAVADAANRKPMPAQRTGAAVVLTSMAA